MFLDNKYTTTYNAIVERARDREVNGYVERHHIIPKSLGGSNDDSNLVKLTAREHYICHLLLTKMLTGKAKGKMVYAVMYLSCSHKHLSGKKTIRTSRIYETLAKARSKLVSKAKKGCTFPPRTNEMKERYSVSKRGNRNPRYIGSWVTPWGTFESSRLAAKACPEYISSPMILNLCKKKNLIPISYLSTCRSKGWISEKYIGKTPKELGFRTA